MKQVKFGFAVLLTFLTIGIAHSQVTFPHAVTIGWDKNLPVDQVIDYTLVHNNGVANQSFTIAETACTHAITDGQCRQTVLVPGAAMQTITLTARNMWGTSAPEIINFTVTAPGKARNIKIRSGS